MTNITYYSEQSWRQPIPLVCCPSCRGSGTFEGKRCFACLSTGKVSQDRVCPTCQRWLSYCVCHHNEVDDPAQSAALPKRGRRAFVHTTMRRGHAQSARGKVGR